MGMKGKGKKGKKKKAEKIESQIFLEQLFVIVGARLKQEKWSVEDAQTKAMKKKLTKKDKARLAARRAEELKQAVEIERLRLIEEEKKRLEQERLDAIEKERRDVIEQELRVEQLKESLSIIKKLQTFWVKQEKKDMHQAEWEQYLKCDGLPDPSNCGEMNTYLHLWDKVKEHTLQDMAIQKTNEVMMLLDTLDAFLDCPSTKTCKRDNWVTIRNRFRDYQQYNLDCLAYRLLRDITNNMDRLDIPTSRKLVSHPSGVFTVCVWALVQLPIPAENPKRPPRRPLHLQFPELCNLEVTFPTSLDVWARCVRVMYADYDHFSYKSESYVSPVVPEGLKMNLAQVTTEEWQTKLRAKEEYRAKVKALCEKEARAAMVQAQAAEREDEVAAAAAATQAALKKQKEYVKVDASAIYLNIEDGQYEEYRSSMATEVGETIMNLRRFRILGGIFLFDLFQQPPQPTTMVLSEVTMSSLPLPKWLEAVSFYYPFSAPPPTEAGAVRQPEEIEEEMKRVELEYERMLHVSLQLPSSVLWLDAPVVCQWEEAALAWTTGDVHDAKHNEERQTVEFKTGRFGPFSFAVFRYNSMPYQAWDVKPAHGNRVIVTIMAAVLILEFTVSGSLVCLSQLQNAPSEALDGLIGQWLPFPKLRRMLKKGGVDVFPAHDAFLYLGGTCEKQAPMEQHLYFQMAQSSLYFNYAWSRWNLLAGRRNIVMQMREVGSQDRPKQQTYSMLMVTPLKALLIDCTEVSQTFNEEGIKKMKFYPDLYHLIIGISTVSMRCKLEKTPFDLVNTVAQVLISTRVLSLS